MQQPRVFGVDHQECYSGHGVGRHTFRNNIDLQKLAPVVYKTMALFYRSLRRNDNVDKLNVNNHFPKETKKFYWVNAFQPTHPHYYIMCFLKIMFLANIFQHVSFFMKHRYFFLKTKINEYLWKVSLKSRVKTINGWLENWKFCCYIKFVKTFD